MSKAKPLEKGDPVYVEWVDASRSAFGWTDDDEIEAHLSGEQIVHTLGFLLRNDDEQVSVAQSHTSGAVLFITNIPRGMLKRIRRVR